MIDEYLKATPKPGFRKKFERTFSEGIPCP